MKINKKLELGIKAVSALKTKSGPTRTADLATEIGTTVNFLEQIMRNLRRAGIVTVKRGPGGGHVIAADQTNVNAYQVATAVGRDFGKLDSDQAPTSRLSKSILDAFLNTTI